MRAPAFCSLTLIFALSACATAVTTPFVVNLTLDQSALAELRSSNEHVTVAAQYYWRPASGGPSHEENELDYVLGGYSVGGETHETTGDARVTFAGRTESNSHVRPGEGDARVLINVFSSRRTHPNNLLNCDVFDEKLSVAAAQGIAIHCNLIR
jgi:hypothetical protein